MVRAPAPEPSGFSMRERIQLQGWMRQAGDQGISRVVLEPAESSGMPGDREFLLVYVTGEEWARWGVARVSMAAVEVWRTGDGATIGTYTTLSEAMESLSAL